MLETLVKKNVAPGFSHASAQILRPVLLYDISLRSSLRLRDPQFFLAVQAFDRDR